MADLRSDFVGISSPNPFWLASAPPTNSEYQVRRAFDAGWGGVVWKTLGLDPQSSTSRPALRRDLGDDRRLLGLNNIELITDRPLDVNLAEIARGQERLARPGAVRLADGRPATRRWQEIMPRSRTTGADGIELNFGCPHGMSERGMGSAVGQVPDYIEMITRWVKEHTGSR